MVGSQSPRPMDNANQSSHCSCRVSTRAPFPVGPLVYVISVHFSGITADAMPAPSTPICRLCTVSHWLLPMILSLNFRQLSNIAYLLNWLSWTSQCVAQGTQTWLRVEVGWKTIPSYLVATPRNSDLSSLGDALDVRILKENLPGWF